MVFGLINEKSSWERVQIWPGLLKSESSSLSTEILARSGPCGENTARTARYPRRIWHIDPATVPTTAGFWVPWLPLALEQSWPFCWRLPVLVDHFSRALVGPAVFFRRPTSRELHQTHSLAVRWTCRPPKYVITDKGPQFGCEPYRSWCLFTAIRPGSVPESMGASQPSSDSYAPCITTARVTPNVDQDAR